MLRTPKPPHEQLKGRYITFRLRDIYLPDPTTVVYDLHAGDELTGKVVDVSIDSHAPGRVFAVVEVEGYRRHCILSVDHILRYSTSRP